MTKVVLFEEVKDALKKTGEQFRDLALERAAAICDEFHSKGLTARECAVAIRLLKEELTKGQ